jgi:hypothetical protein
MARSLGRATLRARDRIMLHLATTIGKQVLKSREVRLCPIWDKVHLLAFTMRESARVLTRNGGYRYY